MHFYITFIFIQINISIPNILSSEQTESIKFEKRGGCRVLRLRCWLNGQSWKAPTATRIRERKTISSLLSALQLTLRAGSNCLEMASSPGPESWLLIRGFGRSSPLNMDSRVSAPVLCSQVLNSYKGGTGKGSWESSKNSFNYYTVRPFVQQID